MKEKEKRREEVGEGLEEEKQGRRRNGKLSTWEKRRDRGTRERGNTSVISWPGKRLDKKMENSWPGKEIDRKMEKQLWARQYCGYTPKKNMEEPWYRRTGGGR